MYDVIVIGAGHSGCEAALAAARIGARTLLMTMNLESIALMPCNPSIGGPAKGHLVREIDALGGEMGRMSDRAALQIRLLNLSKGPAVQALRAQEDKRLYSWLMKLELERTPNLHVKQGRVDDILLEEGSVRGIRTSLGQVYQGKTVIATTGTFLRGRLITGETVREGGRQGEQAAVKLTDSFLSFGFQMGRLKTGTPPRVDARTIDFSKSSTQPGSSEPLYFSFAYPEAGIFHPENWMAKLGKPNPIYPINEKARRASQWRPQLACYLIHSTPRFHELIRENIHRAPLFTGIIEGVGARYCPSVEDKIVRFADKPSHGFFLEPEGWQTAEVYVQGCNTSMPEDVQWEILRSIPALRNTELMRIGYAIEYDYVLPHQLHATLEAKSIGGLYHAGQLNGTTGYEEAAAQGLVAGINAALKVQGKPPFVMGRDESYIGVLIDDLVTSEILEPYRQMTGRAEYRLLLRQDNADLRLTARGYEIGLIDKQRYDAVENKREAVASELERLGRSYLSPSNANEILTELGRKPLKNGINALQYLRRPETEYELLTQILPPDSPLTTDAAQQVLIQARYAGYIEKQMLQIERMRSLESRHIPQNIDFSTLRGMRGEAQQKLAHFRPETVGQASRMAGVNPADISVLLVHLGKMEKVRA
jgi:tRNA uridine 5-carboxymethylaminomethyl modification enzyme